MRAPLPLEPGVNTAEGMEESTRWKSLGAAGRKCARKQSCIANDRVGMASRAAWMGSDGSRIGPRKGKTEVNDHSVNSKAIGTKPNKG